MDNKTPEESVEEAVTSPTEQLENLGQKIKESEDERRMMIEKESIEKGVEAVAPASSEEKNLDQPADKPPVEANQNSAKNAKDESDLVNLLKEDEITEDAFHRLYNEMADDAQQLVQKREELVTEIQAAINGYRSKIISVQRGMKLLNIRARAAALKRDIEDYQKMGEQEQEATNFRNLEKLNDSEELKKLMSAANNCMDALSDLKVSEGVRGKIQNSMQEALSLLRETSGSR